MSNSLRILAYIPNFITHWACKGEGGWKSMSKFG